MSDFNPIPMYISTPPAKYKPSAARLAKLEPDIAAQLAVPPARGKCRGIKNDGDVCGRHAVPGMLTCSRHLAQEATVKAAEEAIEEESTEEEIAEESDDAWQEEVPEVAAEDEEDDEEDDEEYSPMYLSDGGEHQAEVEEVEDEDFYSVLRKPSTKFTGRTATSKSNKNSKGETAVEEFGAGLRIVSLNTNDKKSKGKGKSVKPGSGFGYRKAVEYPILRGVGRSPTKAAQPQDNTSRDTLLATQSQKQTRGLLKPSSGFTIRDDSSRIPVRGESLDARARREASRLNQDRPLDLEEEEQSVGTAYGA